MGLIIVGVISLIVGAACLEAFVKRGKRKPLSHMTKQRRTDDPNAPNQNQDQSLLHTTKVNRDNSVSEKSWLVAKKPEDYTKAMMPDSAKETKK